MSRATSPWERRRPGQTPRTARRGGGCSRSARPGWVLAVACHPPAPPPPAHSSSSAGTAAPKHIAIPPRSILSRAAVGDLCDLTWNSKECDTMFLKIGGPQTNGPSQSAAALPPRAPLPRAPRRPPRGATSSGVWLPAASQARALSLSPRRCRAPGPRPRHGGAAALLGLRGGDHGRL